MGYTRPYETLSHIWVGPFLDETDGVTPETSLVVGSMDIDLHRVDGLQSLTATSNAVNSMSHIAQGIYRFKLEASNMSQYGNCRVMIVISGATPVWEDIEVVNPSVITARQSASYIQAQTSAAFAAYDPPTDTEMDTRLDTLSGAIGGIVDTSLATYDGPTDTEMDGRLDTLSGAVQGLCSAAFAAYDPPTKAEMDTGHSALPQASDVNSQVLDVLNVDTFSEPAQGAPPATPTMRQMQHFPYKSWRNKGTTLSNMVNVYADDASTVDHKATLSDDGTTFTKGEMGSGA